MTKRKKYHTKRESLMGYESPQIERFYQKWGTNYITFNIRQTKPVNPECKPSGILDNLGVIGLDINPADSNLEQITK